MSTIELRYIYNNLNPLLLEKWSSISARLLLLVSGTWRDTSIYLEDRPTRRRQKRRPTADTEAYSQNTPYLGSDPDTRNVVSS